LGESVVACAWLLVLAADADADADADAGAGFLLLAPCCWLQLLYFTF
jgi:hypothetical protein